MKNFFYLLLAATFLASPLASLANDEHAVDCHKEENKAKEECKHAGDAH